MKVTAVKKVTLTEQVMEQIATQIVSGQLKPGEKLPNERDLAEMFQVTRSRIREALRALSLIGMIKIKPGGGSFVADGEIKIPDKTVSWIYHKELNDFDDIYAARKLIESEVYLTCFDNKTPEIVENIKVKIEKINKLSKTDISGEDFLELLSELDLYVAQMCGNRIYVKLMQTILLLRKQSAIRILGVSNSKELSAYTRSKVIEAFEEGDRELLEKRLEEFFARSIKNLHP